MFNRKLTLQNRKEKVATTLGGRHWQACTFKSCNI
uniref:Uncharacterized protein n=1 Tax=Rhizophora mucronata TaxID=61149 RepID=A0A2P2N6I5_RHIMU